MSAGSSHRSLCLSLHNVRRDVMFIMSVENGPSILKSACYVGALRSFSASLGCDLALEIRELGKYAGRENRQYTGTTVAD